MRKRVLGGHEDGSTRRQEGRNDRRDHDDPDSDLSLDRATGAAALNLELLQVYFGPGPVVLRLQVRIPYLHRS